MSDAVETIPPAGAFTRFVLVWLIGRLNPNQG
jgi:hypothetical protein